jgi:hypothetical protein
MFVGGPDWIHWIVMLELICFISLIGIAIHCSVLALDQENLIWWIPLVMLAATMAAAIGAWTLTDIWTWLS